MDKYLSGLPEGFGTVAPAALKDQLAAAKPFLLDVREAKEVTDAGKIEGAVNIPIRTPTKSLAGALNAWTAANLPAVK
jgi:rhodanese-related sulfurtransferase